MSVAPASVASSYRPVRAVSAPDSPFDGMLARGPDDRTVLLVDRDALVDWSGWEAAGDEHICSPIDVVRRDDGHDVVFPLLAERLDRFVARRAAASTSPTDGELVTIGVSVLRGIAAAANDVDRAQWWLNDEGRPMLVPGRGDADVYRASADVLRTAAEAADGAVGEILSEVAGALEADRRRDRVLIEGENALFAAATAEPLATAVLAPLREGVRAPAAAASSETLPPAPRAWWRSLASHVDADLANTVSDAGERLRRHFAAGRSSRRAPMLLAAGVAVVVLVGGLLWPTSDDGAMAGSDAAPRVEQAPENDAAVDPTETPPAEPPAAPSPAPTSPEQILGELLDHRATCADAACVASVVESPARPLVPGAIDLPGEERAVTLVDDLGGLIVLRVAAADGAGASQIVTIVETPEGWRIRDVYPVADPQS